MTSTHYRTCHLCEAMCGLEVEHEGGRVVSIRGDAEDVFSAGYLCPKGVAVADLHEDPDRLRRPLIKEGRGFREATWEEALSRAAALLNSVYAKGGAEAVGVYNGNPVAHNYGSIVVASILGLALRTPNLYSASTMDQMPHMFAAHQMLGNQVLMPVPDLDRVRTFVIIGGNPLASNGSIMSAPNMKGRLKDIQRRGGRVVVIDPRRTETAALADEHLPIFPSTDALLLLALLNVIFAEKLERPGPWVPRASGLEVLRRHVAPWTPERVAATCGIDAEAIVRLAHLVSGERVAVYGRMGVCTQPYGGLCAWLIYALNVVTNNFDRPGGVMRPEPPVNLPLLARLLDRAGSYGRYHTRVNHRPEVGSELPVSALAEEIDTPGSGQIRALLTIAGNPALSAPSAGRLQKALAGLDAMVSVDMYLNETTRHADVILPPESPLERDHYDLALQAFAVRNVTRYSRPLFTNPSARSDFDILLDLLSRTLAKRRTPRDLLASAVLSTTRSFGKERLLDLFIRVGPYGTLNPLAKGKKLSLDIIAQHEHGLDLGPLEPSILDRLETEDKMLHLAPARCIADLERLEADLGSGKLGAHEGQLRLIGRRHLRSNNSWLHNSARLVRGKDRCTLQIHPDDARERAISDGDRVVLSSNAGSLTTTAELTDTLIRGVVSMPHGWGHDLDQVELAVASATPGQNVNLVVDAEVFDPLSGNAALNGVAVEVRGAQAS